LRRWKRRVAVLAFRETERFETGTHEVHKSIKVGGGGEEREKERGERE
jgi:hypothetical protein